MDRSHRRALHGELHKTGQVFRPGAGRAGASFQEEVESPEFFPTSGVAEKSVSLTVPARLLLPHASENKRNTGVSAYYRQLPYTEPGCATGAPSSQF